MINDAWIDIFNRIPADQQNKLMVVTKAGIELSLETVFRLEPTYLVMRGRLAGTTDMGRLFFVPFGEMNYIYLNRVVTEQEVRVFYGEEIEGPASPADGAEAVPVGLAAPAAPGDEPAAAPSTMTPLPGRPLTTDLSTVAKINLLERIRAARASVAAPRPGA